MDNLHVILLILKLAAVISLGMGVVSFIISRWDPNLLSSFCVLVIMGIMMWGIFLCLWQAMSLASKPGL